MSKGLIFWILMLIWFVFGMVVNWSAITSGAYQVVGGNLMLFILLLLLGWHCFGPPVND